MSPTPPLEAARLEAVRLLTRAADAMGLTRSAPPVFRFRPDGKGGELATPAPRRWAETEEAAVPLAERLAVRMELTPRFEEAYSSGGGWLGLDLSRQWRQEVLDQTAALAFPPLDFNATPMPDFPAEIPAEQWRLACLLTPGEAPDPALAARRDGGNPAFRLLYAPRRQSGTPSPLSRRAVNTLALLPSVLGQDDPRRLARLLLETADLCTGPLPEPALSAVRRGLAALGCESPGGGSE